MVASTGGARAGRTQLEQRGVVEQRARERLPARRVDLAVAQVELRAPTAEGRHACRAWKDAG
jgi:hypothetical protein